MNWLEQLLTLVDTLHSSGLLTIFSSEVSLLCFLAIQLIKAHELNLQSANFATANLSGRHRGMSSADFPRSVPSRSRGLSMRIPTLIFKNNTWIELDRWLMMIVRSESLLCTGMILYKEDPHVVYNCLCTDMPNTHWTPWCNFVM